MAYKPKEKKTITKHGKIMGRPVGARNKSKLIKAQIAFDDNVELAAETLVAIMTNDTKKLNIKESESVPMTIRLQACKIILDKSIANEKDKVGDEEEDTSEKDVKAYTGPRVVTKAIQG